MAKRKTASDSEDDGQTPKKFKGSIDNSFLETANLKSKTKLLHKTLNINVPVKQPKVKNEIHSEDETQIQPKAKKKRKAVSPNMSDNEREKQSTIDSILNETKLMVLSTNKVKKAKKSKKRNENNTFSESFMETIKKEPLDSFENSNITSVKDDDSSEIIYLNNGNPDEEMQHSITDDTSDKNEDDSMMEKIEKKVHILQNIQVSKTKTKTPNELLTELYSNIKLSPIKTKLKLKDSSDVYMLRIPKSVDPNDLLNADIDLEAKSKVIIAGEKFIIQPTQKTPDPTFTLSTKTHILEFKSNLVMEKYIKPNKSLTIPIVEKSSVPLPNKLKNRHPLFGSHFEDKIQLDEAVEKKLNEAISKLLKSKKVKKDSKKTEKKEDRMSLVNSTMLPNVTSSKFNPNVSSISAKKKIKKEKQPEETNNIEIFNNISTTDMFNPDDFIPEVRKTKIKKEKPDPVLDISNNVKVTPESSKKAKKRNIKEEPVDFSPPKKKKKKKEKKVYE